MEEVIEKSYDLPLETKNLNVEEGVIKAYVTTFGNEDLVGDVIAKGAVDKFVKSYDNAKNIPLLYEHQRNEIIGEWTKFEIDDYGVLGTAELFDGVSRAEDAKVFLQKGMIGSVSIGFTSKNYENLDNGGREFKEINLLEVSLVRTPANPLAQIVSAKNEDGSMNPRLLEKTFREVGFSNRQAKTFVRYIKECEEREALSKSKAQERDQLFNSVLGMLKEQ